jgi:hypothetical protein
MIDLTITIGADLSALPRELAPASHLSHQFAAEIDRVRVVGR